MKELTLFEVDQVSGGDLFSSTSSWAITGGGLGAGIGVWSYVAMGATTVALGPMVLLTVGGAAIGAGIGAISYYW